MQSIESDYRSLKFNARGRSQTLFAGLPVPMNRENLKAWYPNHALALLKELQPWSTKADVGHVYSWRLGAGIADDQSPRVVAGRLGSARSSCWIILAPPAAGLRVRRERSATILRGDSRSTSASACTCLRARWPPREQTRTNIGTIGNVARSTTRGITPHCNCANSFKASSAGSVSWQNMRTSSRSTSMERRRITSTVSFYGRPGQCGR